METNGFIVDVQTTFEIDGNEDMMQITCPAFYSYTPEVQTILYDDYNNDDTPVHTCMTVENGGVDIVRNSGEMMGLHLRVGEKVSDKYTLDFGMIVVEYVAESIKTRLTADGGTVDMRYVMDMGGVITRNHVVVNVRRTHWERS